MLRSAAGFRNPRVATRRVRVPQARRSITPRGAGTSRGAWGLNSEGCRGFRAVDAAAAHQHLPTADMVGRADQAVLLHTLDQLGGAVVADLQLALEIAGRGLAVIEHDLHGLIVDGVVAAAD